MDIHKIVSDYRYFIDEYGNLCRKQITIIQPVARAEKIKLNFCIKAQGECELEDGSSPGWKPGGSDTD